MSTHLNMFKKASISYLLLHKFSSAFSRKRRASSSVAILAKLGMLDCANFHVNLLPIDRSNHRGRIQLEQCHLNFNGPLELAAKIRLPSLVSPSYNADNLVLPNLVALSSREQEKPVSSFFQYLLCNRERQRSCPFLVGSLFASE